MFSSMSAEGKILERWLLVFVTVFSFCFCQNFVNGHKVSNLSDRSVLNQSILQPLSPKQQSSDLYNFSLVSGYASTTFPKSVEKAFEAYHNKKVVYTCPEDFSSLTSVTLQGSVSHTSFDAGKFLSLLRNKNLAFVGDSLARQSYLDLSGELSPFQTLFRYGKDELTRNQSTLDLPLSKQDLWSQRDYEAFNASILWCSDGYLASLFIGQSHPDMPCLGLAAKSDYVVVSVGAWYKPLYTRVLSDKYYEDLRLKYVKLLKTVTNLRTRIQSHASRTKVVWQLAPHVGMLDEIVYQQPDRSEELLKTHRDGLQWSNWTLGTLWPPVYNHAIRSVAQRFEDDYLDTYRLSYMYMEHFAKINHDRDQERLKPTKVHYDSMHYCPGSIFRAQMYLLQVALSP